MQKISDKSKCSKARAIKNGFTLIEILIVVLIIAILAAIALPQYRKATEKTIIAEAIENLRAIAQANQRYYMATGSYAGVNDIDALDITIPGDNSIGLRKETKYFIYSPTGSSAQWLALAQRKPFGARYYLVIFPSSPNKVSCVAYTGITDIQQKLCDEINAKGSL